MSHSRTQRFLACVLACGCTLGSGTVFAQSITFRRIAGTDTPIPGGTGNFTVLGRQPSVRGGNVAFRAEGSSGQIGVYTEMGGVLGLVADTSTLIPGGTGFFTSFGTIHGGPISFDGVNVVFKGLGSAGQDGIYTDRGGALRFVADTNTAIPGGVGNFASFRFAPSIDSGNIAFSGSDIVETSGRGVYTEIGGVLSVVADGSTPIPGGSGNLGFFDLPSMDGTDTAFRTSGPGFLGLLTRIGGVFNVVMDLNTPIPGDTGTFNTFGAATLDAGNVVVKGGKAGDVTGVYTDLGGTAGTLRIVANNNTPVPRGTGNFGDSFSSGPVAAIDNGNIVFTAAQPGLSFGIYAEMQGSLMKVVDGSDTLDAGTPTSLARGPEALGGNEVAFWAMFADGSEAIFVATIPLNVCGNGILEVGEECDGQGESASCDADCTFAVCGDGTLNVSAGEACDDGNTIDGDGCQGNCQFPGCGNGVLDPGEECDDGNLIDGDGCQSTCLLPVCGDGIVDSGEECDDGNLIDGDGCSSICAVENAGGSVPTVSQWGLTVMSLLLLVGGRVYFRRYRSWS